MITLRHDGQPVPLLLSITRDIAPAFSGKTDSAGKCIIHGLPRDATVRFDVDDPRFAHLDFNPGVVMESDGPLIHGPPLKLATAATVTGTLLSPETQQPLVGIHLGAQSYGTARGGWGTATTDSAGNFTIGRLLPGKYVVSLDVPRDNSTPFVAAAVNVNLTQGQHSHVHFDLERGGFLKGIVRDAATGNGIPGMQVGLYGPSRPRHAAGIESRITGADGRFAFHVPAGDQYPYLAMTAPDGYLQPPNQGMKTVSIAAGQSIEISFDLQPDPAPVIEGRVVDPNGKPAPHALIQLPSNPGLIFARTVAADGDGRFRLHAKPGTKFTASLGDLATVTPAVATADAPMEIQLEKQHGFDILVHITDEAGNPLPASTAQLTTMAGQFGFGSDPRHANAAGIVRFESLPTDGKYEISATADGYGVTRSKVGPPPYDEPRELELPITLHKATEEISGRVLDKDNKPVPGITVVLSGSGVLHTTTGADGHFLFHVVKRASATLYLRLDDGNILNPTQARAGDKDIELHNYKDAPPSRDPLP